MLKNKGSSDFLAKAPSPSPQANLVGVCKILNLSFEFYSFSLKFSSFLQSALREIQEQFIYRLDFVGNFYQEKSTRCSLTQSIRNL
jgi:hypothetical protein